MAQDATINARLPQSLKRGGTAVLEREGVSPTTLIRSLYAYIDREQKIPECLDVAQAEAAAAIAQKRRAARSVAGLISLPAGYDSRAVRDAREARIRQKYGELL